jgi:hypothetical protein
MAPLYQGSSPRPGVGPDLLLGVHNRSAQRSEVRFGKV